MRGRDWEKKQSRGQCGLRVSPSVVRVVKGGQGRRQRPNKAGPCRLWEVVWILLKEFRQETESHLISFIKDHSEQFKEHALERAIEVDKPVRRLF